MLWRRHRPQRSPAPEPIDASTDPLPSTKDLDDIDAHIDDTDALLDEHDTAHPRDDNDRPILPDHFDLNAPDDDAVALLRTLTDDPSVHDR